MDLKETSKKFALILAVVVAVAVVLWLSKKSVKDFANVVTGDAQQGSFNAAGLRGYGVDTLTGAHNQQVEAFAPGSLLPITIIRGSLLVILVAIILGYILYRNLSTSRTATKSPSDEASNNNPGTEEFDRLVEENVKQRIAQLSRTNTRLQAQIAEPLLAEKDLQRRIKQLSFFYGLSKLVEQCTVSLDHVFQETAELICNAYQHPRVTCVRITFDGMQYKTDNFAKSELSQYAQIKVRSQKAGGIEVYYLAEDSEPEASPFLKEERDLLDAVAKRLGTIAELKQASDKLRLFQSLLNGSNDCIFVIDPEWGRFLDVNDTTCTSLGYTRKELLAMTVKDIEELTSDDLSWQEQTNKLGLKGDVIKQSCLRRKDASTFFVETSLKKVSQEKKDYIIAITRDITERKQAEQRQASLIQDLKASNQKTESINQELKDFAYIVSHDLKSPLWGIKALADWISVDYGDKLGEEGKEQMDLLLAQVKRMHNLIDGVLRYSKVGHLREQTVQIDLNDLVADVIEMIAVPENISITIENQLPVVNCEEMRMRQVFENLLSNAVKYMDKPQGQIRIGCVETDDFWKFSVADNGLGIEEKHFERIFKIFQTLSNESDFENTGIGLTLIKKIVELYNGSVWVESKEGQGSTFFFTLPKELTAANLQVNAAH